MNTILEKYFSAISNCYLFILKQIFFFILLIFVKKLLSFLSINIYQQQYQQRKIIIFINLKIKLIFNHICNIYFAFITFFQIYCFFLPIQRYVYPFYCFNIKSIDFKHKKTCGYLSSVVSVLKFLNKIHLRHFLLLFYDLKLI